MSSELKIKIKFKKKEDEAPTTVEISRKRLATDVTPAQDEEEEDDDTVVADETMEDADSVVAERSSKRRSHTGEPKKKRTKYSSLLIVLQCL